MTPSVPRQTALAMRLYEAHREVGGLFWHELGLREQNQWHRVAHHLEVNLSAGALAQVARP